MYCNFIYGLKYFPITLKSATPSKTSEYEKQTTIIFEMQFKMKNLQVTAHYHFVDRYHFYDGV